MINIDLIYRRSKSVCNKAQSGNFKPALFITYANMTVQKIFNKGVEVYQQTQQITDEMQPFLKTKRIIVPDTGRLVRPVDYVNVVSLRSVYRISDGQCGDEDGEDEIKPKFGFGTIDLLDINQIVSRNRSESNPPTLENGFAEQLGDYYQLYPNNIGMVEMIYFRKPVEVNWAHTLNGNGVEVYAAAGSVDFEFNWQTANKLIAHICRYFGVTVRDPELNEMIKETA